jgi:adenosylhomocysteine nucleosidase
MMCALLFLIALQPGEKLGIISAMDSELALIKQDMQVEATDTIASRIFDVGTINEMPCVCVRAGVGKVNAAITAQLLIREYDVAAVIFTGVAGGIDPLLDIGDIVISRRVVYHDYGQIVPGAFIAWDTVGFRADSFLVAIAVQAAGQVAYEEVPKKICKETGHYPQAAVGTIATGDQFISSEEKRKWIETTFHAACVEMEGAAVAHVCVLNNIPFVIIRSLSDLANENADVDFELFVEYAARTSNLIVKEMLRIMNE